MDPAQDWLALQAQRHNQNMQNLSIRDWAFSQPRVPQPTGYGWNNDFRRSQEYVGDQGQWQLSDWHAQQGQQFHNQMRAAGYRDYPVYFEHTRRAGWMQREEPFRGDRLGDI